MWAEWLLYGLIGILALISLVIVPMSAGWIRPRTAAIVSLCLIGVPLFLTLLVETPVERPAVSDTSTAADVPALRNDGLFARSDSCRSCHAREYETWHASFHRTMTQVASPESVVAPFDGRTMTRYGQEVRVERRGDEFWVDMVEPEWNLSFVLQDRIPPTEGAPRSQRRIAMTTGSHSFQAYWYVIDGTHELWLFPWRYLIDDNLWIHVDDAFLQPPPDRPALGHQVWNQSCIPCHSVGGQPGANLLTRRFDKTRVAELGIACEACHGPALKHVESRQKSFGNVSLQHHGDQSDTTIFNPGRTDHAASTQMCGSCHSHFDYDPENPANKDRAVAGNELRPGDNMRDRGRFPTVADEHVMKFDALEITVSCFWADGACRSGGREYNGLTESACFLKGQVSCLSCHQMHGTDPDDQLIEGMRTDTACLQCHTDMKQNISAHSHHAAGSSGSECMNCHMPYSSFALLRGIRSHRIDSPAIVPFGENVRLNACNLCHLDKTQAWTAEALSKWYGKESPPLSGDDQTIAASVLWLLKGDGGQRVLSAWHFHWPEARSVSGTEWMIPFLATAMNDPYSAVRYNAWKAVRAVMTINTEDTTAVMNDLFEDLTGDRRRMSDKLLRDWLHGVAATNARIPEALLGTSGDSSVGRFSESRLLELIQQRNDRPMVIVE